MHGNAPEPPEMSRTQLEDHYDDLLREAWAEHDATLAAIPMWRLIVAEQARARRLHPDDHAGHPSNDFLGNWGILETEVTEVELEETSNDTIDLAWELIQVAGVAAAWAERLIADGGFTHDDLLALIDGTDQ